MFLFGMFPETSLSTWFNYVDCLVISSSISLICSACFMYQEGPVEHMVGSRNIISKNGALVSNWGATVRTNGEGITFLNSYKSDALRSKSKIWLFGRMLPEYSRLTKTMQFILMKLYTRKIGIWTNDWSYWIHAICSNFLLKRKESKRVTGVRGEYLRDSEIIEEVLYRARKTLERNLWSQVSRRDNFTLLIMANILSELGQMWVSCWILNRIILICTFHGLEML